MGHKSLSKIYKRNWGARECVKKEYKEIFRNFRDERKRKIPAVFCLKNAAIRISTYHLFRRETGQYTHGTYRLYTSGMTAIYLYYFMVISVSLLINFLLPSISINTTDVSKMLSHASKIPQKGPLEPGISGIVSEETFLGNVSSSFRSSFRLLTC